MVQQSTEGLRAAAAVLNMDRCTARCPLADGVCHVLRGKGGCHLGICLWGDTVGVAGH